MKLLSLLVFIFLLFSLSKESDISDAFIDSIYDYLPYIINGISSSNSTQCSQIFLKNKQKLLPLLQDVISGLLDGASIAKIGLIYALRVTQINGLITKCKLIDLGIFLDGFDSQDKIEDIGQAIQNNNKELYYLERDIKNAKDLEDRLYYFGKIIYNIINFEFS